MGIADKVREVLDTLPDQVVLVGAAKTRSPEEVAEAVEAGLPAIGHNYVQEAEAMHEALGDRVRAEWHLIGHLQRNKAKRAVALFDVIETVDSPRLARALERHCAALDKVMPVLIEVNSGEESSKHGVLPDRVGALARVVSEQPHLRLRGLMTMGPATGDPELARPYFRLTRDLAREVQGMGLPRVEMQWLSMGMSNSYRVAVEEGANIVRIGTRLFGPRA